LAAEIHQENHPWSSNRRACIRPSCNHRARRLMSGRGSCAVEKLWSFRTAKRIGMNPQQKLPRPHLRNRFLGKVDLLVPDKSRNSAVGR